MSNSRYLQYIGRKINDIGGKDPDDVFFQKAYCFVYGNSQPPDMSIAVALYHRGIIGANARYYVHYLQTLEEETEATCMKLLEEFPSART